MFFFYFLFLKVSYLYPFFGHLFIHYLGKTVKKIKGKLGCFSFSSSFFLLVTAQLPFFLHSPWNLVSSQELYFISWSTRIPFPYPFCNLWFLGSRGPGRKIFPFSWYILKSIGFLSTDLFFLATRDHTFLTTQKMGFLSLDYFLEISFTIIFSFFLSFFLLEILEIKDYYSILEMSSLLAIQQLAEKKKEKTASHWAKR